MYEIWSNWLDTTYSLQGVEGRLMAENTSLTRERNNINDILRNMQVMQGEIERNAEDSRRRLETQLSKSEGQLWASFYPAITTSQFFFLMACWLSPQIWIERKAESWSGPGSTSYSPTANRGQRIPVQDW
jgi:hypothetical protein